MRIIDLLNLIAKGEGVPKVVEYRNWNNNSFDKMLVCYENIIDKLDKKEILLNDEVEIIEEEKEIEYITLFGEKVKSGSTVNWLNEPNENEKKLASCIDGIAIFVNNLADVINDMRDKE